MILDTNAVAAFFEGVPVVCEVVGKAESLVVPSIVLGSCWVNTGSECPALAFARNWRRSLAGFSGLQAFW